MLGLEQEALEPVQPSEGVWKASSAQQPGMISPAPLPAQPAAPVSRPLPADSPPAAVPFTLRKIDRPTSPMSAPAWLSVPGPTLAPASASDASPEPPPLFGPPRGRAILSTAVATTVDEGEVDIQPILDWITRGQPVRALPRRPSLTLRRGVQLLLNVGAGMTPYQRDREQLRRGLDDILADDQLTQYEFVGCPTRGMGRGVRAGWKPWQPPAPGTPVVAVTDLGLGGPPLDRDRADAEEWLEFARLVHGRGHMLMCLVPYEARRWPPVLARSITLIHWSERTTVGSVRRALREARSRLR